MKEHPHASKDSCQKLNCIKYNMIKKQLGSARNRSTKNNIITDKNQGGQTSSQSDTSLLIPTVKLAKN
jgi:hypothetical protein